MSSSVPPPLFHFPSSILLRFSLCAGAALAETKHSKSLMEKISEKIHSHDSSSSFSSDSDNEKEVKHHSVSLSSSTKCVQFAINRLFGMEKLVHHIFRGGKLKNLTSAVVFLWMNKKISASVLGGATIALHGFYLNCWNTTCSLCLFLWSNVSTFIQKSRPKIPEVHLPEDPFLQIVNGLRIEINMALACLREIASGHALKKFLA
ncbi:hypothetical protein MKX01_008577, partial [Papaver californicum]